MRMELAPQLQKLFFSSMVQLTQLLLGFASVMCARFPIPFRAGKLFPENVDRRHGLPRALYRQNPQTLGHGKMQSSSYTLPSQSRLYS